MGSQPSNQDELDLEIRQLQDELTQLRKQRSLIELKTQLAKERILLAEAQARLAALSQTPTTETHDNEPLTAKPPAAFSKPEISGPVVKWVRGVKRPYSEYEPESYPEYVSSDTNNSCSAAEPPSVFPRLPVMKRYNLASRRDFLILMSTLENHFERWKSFYTVDEKMIREALPHLPERVKNRWSKSVENQTHPKTWQAFRSWVETHIHNKTSPEVAELRYASAYQRSNQSIRDFMSYLGKMETNLPRLLTEEQRYARLWDGILPSLRDSAPPDSSPNSYIPYLKFLLGQSG